MKSILKKLSLFFIVSMFVLTMANNFIYADEGKIVTEDNQEWKRYDNFNSKINYVNFNTYYGSGSDSTKYHYLSNKSGKVSFKFTGTKFKINGKCIGNYVTNYVVTIDGVASENIAQPNVELNGTTYEIKNLPQTTHTVVIEATNPHTQWGFQMFSIDIDATGQLLSDCEIGNLTAIPGDSKVTLNWDEVTSATEYIVKYGISSGNYTEIVTVSAESYKEFVVDNLTNGTSYFFVVCPKVNGSIGEISNEAIATPNIKNIILDIETQEDKIKINEIINVSIVVDNIENIAAEDIIIKYDSEKLQYIGYEEVDGIKLVYDSRNNGELRFILASKGEDNIVNAKTILLNLKFKGIKNGEALVDITRGRVSDGIEMEKDLTDDQCGQAIIIVEGVIDVNNSGEFTLLDLAIVARHLNKDPNSSELIIYNTDIVKNDLLDEYDLLEIGRLILLNPNYQFNH